MVSPFLNASFGKTVNELLMLFHPFGQSFLRPFHNTGVNGCSETNKRNTK